MTNWFSLSLSVIVFSVIVFSVLVFSVLCVRSIYVMCVCMRYMMCTVLLPTCVKLSNSCQRLMSLSYAPPIGLSAPSNPTAGLR